MAKIDEMSLKEILKEIELSISDRDMYTILGRDNEAFKKWKSILAEKGRKKAEIEQRISYLSKEGIINEEALRKTYAMGDSGNISFTAEDFEPIEDYINKRALVLLTLYNWQKILEENNGESKEKEKRAKRTIKKVMNIIGKEDFDVIMPVIESKEKYITRIEVINAQEVVNIIRKARRLRELQKDDEGKKQRVLSIDEDIGIIAIAQLLTERDFTDGLTRSNEIGTEIVAQISYNAMKKYQEAHPEIDVYAEILEEENDSQRIGESERETITGKFLLSKEYRQSMREAIIANYKYLDIDMMLLIASYRYLEMLEYDYDEENLKEYIGNANIDISPENIASIVDGLARKIEGNPEFRVNYEDETYVEFSKDALSKELKRFSNGRYIKRGETEAAKISLLSNEKRLAEIEQDVLRTVELTDEEVRALIENSEDNLTYLINQDFVEKDKIMAIIYIRERCSEKLFFTAYQKGLLEYDDIVKLFEDGKIGSETIAKIGNIKLKQRITDYAKVVLRESYLAITLKEDAKPEELEMFVRSIVLYKKMCIEGRTEEEIASNSFELVSSFEDNISSEILQELYQFGIISLDIAADWGADLTEMLASNSIKPTDLKNLYAKKVISIDEIKNVLINGSLSYEEKLDLIYSTFDGESEEEALAREELIELLGMGESYKSEERGTGKKRGIGNGTRNKEFITEPHTRWKLLSLLDRDYSKGCLPEGRKVIDGHRVFLLPNHNKVVIERMHEKRNGKRVSAYGNATYVMGIEEFYKSIDDIIIDGAINRTYLREAQERGQATKIIHSKHWGDSIKRQFGVNTQNSRYTQEEINEIDKAIVNVEFSRKERE